MATKKDLKPLVEGVSQEGRKRILTTLLVHEARGELEQYKKGEISHSDMAPMSAVSDKAGVTSKHYRNYLNEEVRIPVEPVLASLSSLPEPEQQVLILIDWADSLLRFREVFPQADLTSSASEQVGRWGLLLPNSKLEKEGDHYVYHKTEVQFDWIGNRKFVAKKEAVEEFLGEDYERGWEEYENQLKMVKSKLPKLKNNEVVIEELREQIILKDLKEKSKGGAWPFEMDALLHAELMKLARRVDEEGVLSDQEIDDLAVKYSPKIISRLKEICHIRLFDDGLINKVKRELERASQKIEDD